MNMKKQLITILIFFIYNCSFINAQLIDNNLNFYFGYRNNSILGGKFTNENGFISPSLYSNMDKSNSYSIKGIYKYKNKLSLGLGIEFNTINNWNLKNYDNYNNSKVNNFSINPIIQMHTSNHERGIFNRLKLYIQISPIIGISSLTLNNPYLEFQSNTIPYINIPSSSTDLFGGFEFSGGFEFILTSGIGIFCNYGYKNCWIRSDFYNDKRFSNTFIEGGLFLRLNKNKHFYY